MRSSVRRKFLWAGVGLGALIASHSGYSQELPSDVKELLRQLQQTVQEQQKRIAEQERRLTNAERLLDEREETLEKQQAVLTVQAVQLEGLSHQVGEISQRWWDDYGTVTFYGGGLLRTADYKPGDMNLAQTKPRAPTPVPPAVPPAEVAPDESVQEERPESEQAREELLVEAGAVLLPRGTIQIEPSVEYTHVSTDRVAISGFTIFEAIIIGLIRVDELQRDVLTGSVNVRYGVTNRLQVEGRVPYTYREDSELLGVGTNQESELSISGHGIGDVELGASYQVLTQDGYIPGTILRLRGRFPTGESAFDIETQLVDVAGRMQPRLKESPTGSGFYSVAPGATFVWRLDPVAFFAGGSYTFNLERNQSGFGTIDPGDTIEAFGGMNIALSDRIGLNLSFVDQITSETEQDGMDQNGTDFNDARLTVGTSIALAPNMSLLISSSAGLTDESPDFTVGVSLPINFSLF